MSFNVRNALFFCIISVIVVVASIAFLNFTSSNNYPELDENRTFWTYSDITKAYSQVNATLLGSGKFCALYMDEQYTMTIDEAFILTEVEDICAEFDNVIYPRTIDLAGHPDGTIGDIDGDPRIFILFLNSINYYSDLNEIENNHSNQCEMIYINYELFQNLYLYPVIAHEFHHLIWFNHEWVEPPFVLEAIAQFAMYHAGYLDPYDNLAPQVALFLPHPENSPLYWDDDLDYGSSYLFAFYLAEKYGVQTLRDLITNPFSGSRGIENVLQNAGYNITFNELYINWITALTLDQLGFQEDLFGFVGLDARISSYELVNDLPLLNNTLDLNHYAFKIFKLGSISNNFTIAITKYPQVNLGVVIAIHDFSGWHVQQKLYYEEKEELIDSSSGFMIDEVYIILSYISKNPPLIPAEWGPGPSIRIELTLEECIDSI